LKGDEGPRPPLENAGAAHDDGRARASASATDSKGVIEKTISTGTPNTPAIFRASSRLGL
jgi:hypothetical protein